MKYRMTQAGHDEFVANRQLYRTRTMRSKIMNILKSGVGYTLDSLNSQISNDPIYMKAGQGKILDELTKLIVENYLEVVN